MHYLRLPNMYNTKKGKKEKPVFYGVISKDKVIQEQNVRDFILYLRKFVLNYVKLV